MIYRLFTKTKAEEIALRTNATFFGCILDRLIYNDECSGIDANLSDCNVGARQNRNIRDNIFVLIAITITIL